MAAMSASFPEVSKHHFPMASLVSGMYMFVVSGHLYMPLPSSQRCGLRVKIKDGFGTRPPTFLGAGLSILVFLWHLSPVGVHHVVWFEEP